MIGEIIVHLLVMVQNNERCTVQVLKLSRFLFGYWLIFCLARLMVRLDSRGMRVADPS
jgi:hypothetical protein